MDPIILDNAQIWTGDGSVFDGHVVIDGPGIEAVAAGRYRGPSPAIDLNGAALSPGLIDLMVLGGFNLSILRDDPLELARQYLRLGVTACQFCTGTLPFDSMRQVAGNVRRAMDRDDPDAARVLGLYLEGPFQQPDLTGASLREYALAPMPENIERVLGECGGAVTMINVSPGLEDDAAAVGRIRQTGKIVSMAHSNAPADRVLACIDAGTSVLGHVWDNNSGRIGDSGVQQPTLEHVALTDERVRFIHLICDGTHVHPTLIEMILRCRGAEAVCLVTDGNQRSGCPDGPFISDDGRRFYKEKGVCRTDKGWLAGSATLLPDMFRNFVRFTGMAPHKAIRTVTLNPAACLGLQDRMGLVAPGRVADLVMWDDNLRARRIWWAGREIEDVSSFAEVKLRECDFAGRDSRTSIRQ